MTFKKGDIITPVPNYFETFQAGTGYKIEEVYPNGTICVTNDYGTTMTMSTKHFRPLTPSAPSHPYLELFL